MPRPKTLLPALLPALLACSGLSSQAFTLDGGQGYVACFGAICRPGEYCDADLESCEEGCASDLNCAAPEECARDYDEERTGRCAPPHSGAREGELCDAPGLCEGGVLACYHPAGDLHGTCLRRCTGYLDCELGSRCCPVPGITSTSACVPNADYDCRVR